MSVVRNTAINTFGKAFTGITTLAITALLARTLGAAELGLLLLVRGTVSNTTLSENLVGAGIVRYLSPLTSTEQQGERDRVVAAGLLGGLFQAAVMTVLVCGLLLAFFNQIFARVPAHLLADARTLVLLFGAAFFLRLLSMTIMRVAEAFQRYDLIRRLDIMSDGLLVLLFAVSWAASGAFALRTVAVIYLAGELIRFLFSLVLLKVLPVRLTGAWGPMERKVLGDLVRFGRPIFIWKIFTLLSSRSHILVIGVLISVEAVAQFQIAAQVVGVVAVLLGLLTSALPPVIAHRAVWQPDTLPGLFLRGSRYLLAAACALACVEWLVGPPAITLWVGPGFDVAAALASLLMIKLVVTHHYGLSAILLVAMNRHRRFPFYFLGAGVVGLAVIVLSIDRLGVYAVIAGALAEAVLLASFILRDALQAVRVSITTYLRQAILPSWFVGVVGVVLFLAATSAGWEAMRPWWRAGVLLLVLLTLAWAWTVILSQSDRHRLLLLIRQPRLKHERGAGLLAD